MVGRKNAGFCFLCFISVDMCIVSEYVVNFGEMLSRYILLCLDEMYRNDLLGPFGL